MALAATAGNTAQNTDHSNLNDTLVRSRTALVRGLLRRAFNGESKYTVPEMKAEIAARLNRARDVPEGHKVILNIIRQVEGELAKNREILKSAGLTDAEIGAPSRALTRLSITEKLMEAAGDTRLQKTATNYGDAVDTSVLFCEEAIAEDEHAAAVVLSPRLW